MLLVFALCGGEARASDTQTSIAWQGWSEGVFEKAKKENKFVILDLEAIWCHWCHVMADTTYQDPKVVGLINSRYLPVRVDQDANPDISLRYEDWGWPATVVFSADGTEIVKRRGYIPPPAMAALLEAIIKDPTPGPSISADLDVKPAEQTFLNPEQKKKLEEEHNALYDTEFAGWGMQLKLIDSNSLEFAMVRAMAGDESEARRAQATLDAAINLLDAEWGGFFQYSDERNWKSPHFEKIMLIQSQYMRLYAIAYSLWKEPRTLQAAKRVNDYLARFWTSPEGAFYTSQDADVNAETRGKDFYSLRDADRVKLGKMPEIDTHVYSRENGWMIASLAVLHDVTGEEKYLDEALSAARWILQNRNLSGGGFRHDAADRAGPYLGDTLAMGQAFLNLYISTADPQWLELAEKSSAFIEKFFKDENPGGFITAVIPSGATGVFQKPVKQVDENVSVARLANSLFHFTGKEKYKKMAADAMRYLASPVLLQNKRFLTGLLLADRELSEEPTHLTVVGPKNDETTKALYRTALGYPPIYRRIEWWDTNEGPLPNPDVDYPELKKPAAFLCANKSCSVPFFLPEKLIVAMSKLKK